MGLEFSALAAIVVSDDLPRVECLGPDIVGVRMIDSVPPGKPSLVRAARGFFPFGFCGQTILLTGFRA